MVAASCLSYAVLGFVLRDAMLVLQGLCTRAALDTQILALGSVRPLKSRLQFENLIRTSSFLHLFSAGLALLFLTVLCSLGCLAGGSLATAGAVTLCARAMRLEGIRLRCDLTGIRAVFALLWQFV